MAFLFHSCIISRTDTDLIFTSCNPNFKLNWLTCFVFKLIAPSVLIIISEDAIVMKVTYITEPKL